MTAPKVFVSHASEDRQRFVMAFAQRLRENGVDAWLDQWEMKPGDSLVDKIFEEGLRNAQAVVIVLSAASVNKPWVREELNFSVVKRIGKGLKIIPVVIDACEIPEALQSTLWQRVDDLEHYDEAFQRVLNAIFDRSPKPPLGAPPERFTGAEPKVAGNTVTDERVLHAIYEHEVGQGRGWLSLEAMHAMPELAEMPEDDVLASLEVLKSRGLVLVDHPGGPVLISRLTLEGFRAYAEAYIADYQELQAKVAALLLNEDEFENESIARRIGRPVSFTNFVLDVLEAAGHIKLAKFGMGRWEVFHISPTLKRALAGANTAR
jgi:hypothetical protein